MAIYIVHSHFSAWQWPKTFSEKDEEVDHQEEVQNFEVATTISRLDPHRKAVGNS